VSEKIKWPNGAKSAVGICVDFDGQQLWLEHPGNEDRVGLLSQGTYGGRVAVPLILDILDRTGVRATFFVPGRIAEDWPGRVRDIVAAGHELANHGYRHLEPVKLPPEEEEQELLRGQEILSEFGTKVVGFRSPGLEPSPRTVKLLEKHGFKYSSDLMADIRPYRYEGSSIIELPTAWTTNDTVHFWFDSDTWTKKISTTEEARQIWEEEFLGIHELGGLTLFTVHPEVIGRPSRLRFFEAHLARLRERDDIWIAPLGDIAAHVDSTGAV
jgi:peptidoglycan/xylan/chitin deacetylase (PgdA/CDA1 family)